eukprot:1144416-Pelagomonas_calceolata.AAC.1
MKSMGIRRVTGSSPCLRAERSLLKSASDASKFISILDRVSMKLQSKHGGCVGVMNKKKLCRQRKLPLHQLLIKVTGKRRLQSTVDY